MSATSVREPFGIAANQDSAPKVAGKFRFCFPGTFLLSQIIAGNPVVTPAPGFGAKLSTYRLKGDARHIYCLRPPFIRRSNVLIG